MPMDGICISNICRDIREKAVGGRVDKVFQPEKDELVLAIRSKGVNHRLMLTSSASHPRLHFVRSGKPNPTTAPLFCMVLRKHLGGGRLVDARQPGFERIVELGISSPDEMGDFSEKRLIIEIMGKHSNIILVDERGIILEAARHVPHSISTVRQVLPGLPYILPPGQGKADPQGLARDVRRDGFARMLEGARAWDKVPSFKEFVYKSFDGIAPSTAAEVCHRANIDAGASIGVLGEDAVASLYDAFSEIMEDVEHSRFLPRIITRNGVPHDFFSIRAKVYEGIEGYGIREYQDPSDMLEEFYSTRDAHNRFTQKTADIRRLIQTNIERCVKKQEIHERTRIQAQGLEEYRIKGELLTANIHRLSQGMTTAALENFYEEGSPVIEIGLDAQLSPAQNAQRYFRRYNKDKRTQAALEEQVATNNNEREYLEALIETLETCVDEADIEQVRDELYESGYVKRRGVRKGAVVKASPLKFAASDGAEILVGKNNRQNDDIFRAADNRDIWMHVKDMPGSHVIVRHMGGGVSDEAIREAASLAARYSKARESSNVPVDYTLRKHVRKPSGAKPGMVIYDNHKTLYVTP